MDENGLGGLFFDIKTVDFGEKIGIFETILIGKRSILMGKRSILMGND
jgi:hypothetical protein